MYTYKIGISAQEHDDFVKQSSQTNLLQSASWAKVKDNWDNERIGFYKNNQLVASASILIKPLPLSMTMLYIPRGPIMDYQDQELLHFVLTSLKKFAKTKKALFIKFDPSLFLVQNQSGEERQDNPKTLDLINNLQKAGAIWLGRTELLDETIQPRFQANIYKDNFSEELLSKSTRQAIRTARNKGIQVQFGGSELLDDFSALMKKTENRKSIHLRGQDYYQKLLDTYPEQSYITLASINLNERLENLQVQKSKAEKEASKFTEKTKPGKIENNKQEQKRLQEEMDFLAEKMTQGVTTVPLSGTLVLEYGTTSENIYAGMDEEYRRYQPALLTWYETAKHAFERGADWQNMGGVENDLNGGLYHFKSKFNPTIEEYVGEFNLPTNPLYHLSNFAYTLRKKYRSKH
ncbi:aminoacyltransferase [Streptococcus constellatus]|uniref:FemAB family protein n=1 Tax=Streptococcus constellatus subsp. constellatus SK53 TaxID=1095730 RepID=A0AAD2SVL8_STRCV|nr:aminoacyltransferase [Streptococcus constellatus]EID20069.1 FemAB family protein [Streptococcus constellatus subsp. constellatus SK53]MDP1484924.1 aminoacyltransferase [Streptococcus constellatus]QQT05674.1 aminoacyltransferase [Streptococcus constellatus]RID95613.1 aminoacyltransferase [Streptococcus constellatus]SUN40218.1 peptidoglycan branched peptide synthesis protein [Streptococcus constellatus]